jgi:serine/threonine-protein kinase HipA
MADSGPNVIRYLRLFLHGPQGRCAIGFLSRYGDLLRVSFDSAYVNDPGRPTLSLSYIGETDPETRAILTSMRDARVVAAGGHWPPYFRNLLPEGHNRARLARERGCDEDDEFELLAAAGHDLMGGVEIEPVPVGEGVPEAVRRWHSTMGLDVLEPGFVEAPVEDAAALPGVVTKFSAIQEGRRYVVRRHNAAGSVILKLPSTRHPDLVQNEAAGYRLCEALGLHCAQATIIGRDEADLPEEVEFPDILAIKRFDRLPDGRRRHMEEFTQVFNLPPSKKYGSDLQTDFARVLAVLDALSADPSRDAEEFIRRFVAFILLGNTDAHLKNWALVYPDGIKPILAPLYDPVCVTAFFDHVDPLEYGINRAIDAKLSAFDFESLRALLRASGVARVARLERVARKTITQAQDVWPTLLQNAPDSVRLEVLRRLQGGVALARRP